MTVVAFTSANIRPHKAHGTVILPGIAGGAITVGQLVYAASDGDYERADGNVSATLARVIGVAIESYDGEATINTGDPVSVVPFGPVSGFTSLTAGAHYYLSDTIGELDTAVGAFDRHIGIGIELAGEVVLWVNPVMSDVAS